MSANIKNNLFKNPNNALPNNARNANAKPSASTKTPAASAPRRQVADSFESGNASAVGSSNNARLGQSGQPAASANGAVAAQNPASAPSANDTAVGANTAQATPEVNGPEDLRYLSELKDASPEELQTVYDAVQKLSSGDTSEKLRGLSTLAKMFPETLPNLLKDMGIQDNKLVELATDKNALNALATLTDANASNADKSKAALQLAEVAGKALGVDEASDFFKAIGLAPTLVDAIATWSNPNASGVEKGKAALAVAEELKGFLGNEFAGFSNELRKLDGSLKAVGAALTLLDPNATTEEKVLAGAQMALEIPNLSKELPSFFSALGEHGINAQALEELSGRIENFVELGEKVGKEELNRVVSGLADNPDALSKFVGQLSDMDAADAKRLMQTVGSMRPENLAKVLGDAELFDGLANMARNLDDEAAKTLGKLTADMDEGMLRSLVKLTGGASPEVLNAAIKALAPVLDKVDGKMLGEALKALDGVLSKMGVEFSKEVTEKVLKNLLKIVPVAGLAPNAVDAVNYAQKAAELRDKNADLSALAMVGTRLNVADAAVGALLTLTGVGTAVDVAASIGFSGVELVFDIAFEKELSAFNADPDNYQAPDWVKAVNLVGNDPITLVSIYGPEGAAELAQWGVEKGIEGALTVAETLGVAAANAAGEGLHMTAEMIHLAADVVRNPEKYADAVLEDARELLNSAIEKGGELAETAKQVVGDLIEEAKALGKKGLETLKFFAQNPDELAKLALKGIEEVVSWALETGDKLYQAGVEALETLQQGWKNVSGAVAETVDELISGAKAAVGNFVDQAVALGEKGIEALAWAAAHPGEAMEKAKKAVGDLLAKGGAAAKKTWDAIKGLGAQGKALAESAIKGLQNAGAEAVETLRYIAENPGEFAKDVGKWVGETLDAAIRKGGAMAEAAAKAVVDFVDKRVQWAQDVAQNLIMDGVDTFTNVAKAWANNLTEGAKEVLEAVGDLGQAGKEAVEKFGKAAGGKVKEFATGFLEFGRQTINRIPFINI